MLQSRLNGTKSPSFSPPVQCCFGLTANVCVSGVAANNIGSGKGGGQSLGSLSNDDGKTAG